MSSRYIKAKIKHAIEKRDKFKCVWCGTKIMEKHHFIEFHLGGENSVENLITLCSNCHTIVHTGGIDPIELLIRRNNLLTESRIGGNTSFTINPPVTFDLGGARFMKGQGPILAMDDTVILGYKIDGNNELTISCRFYDENQSLIFWMFDNYFCTTGNFIIQNRVDEILIQDTSEKHLVLFRKLSQNEIQVNFMTYFNGRKIQALGNINSLNRVLNFGTFGLLGGTIAFTGDGPIIRLITKK